MKSLLDLLSERLPEGAEIRNAKETSNRFKYIFAYDGYTSNGNMMKMCAPGYEERYIAREIATHMANVYLQKGDLEKAKALLKV